MKNRIGIYVFYDEFGVVDDYVLYFLNAFKEHVNELCVVVNGDLNSINRKKLEDICDKYVERENIYFDTGACKQIIEMYGYDYLATFDELLMCNHTFFGPIYPLSEMFDEMDKRDCDFWGMNRYPAIGNVGKSDIKIREHIQSHFLAVRNSILKSPHFKEYWDTLKLPNDYYEAIDNHEMRFTNFFEQLGYTSSVYIDKDKYFKDFHGNPTLVKAHKQLIEDRCPIIKRKVFYIKDDNSTKYTKLPKKIELITEFIDKCTDYDVDLIKKNIIRTQYINSKNFNDMCFRDLYKKTSLQTIIYNLIKYNILHCLDKKRIKYADRKDFYKTFLAYKMKNCSKKRSK